MKSNLPMEHGGFCTWRLEVELSLAGAEAAPVTRNSL